MNWLDIEIIRSQQDQSTFLAEVYWSIVIVIIIIIIIIKCIYKVQDRLRGHKCAMSAEITVW